MVPVSIPNVPYHIHFTRGERDARSDIINYKFTSYDVICLLISLCLGAWYLFKKVSCMSTCLAFRFVLLIRMKVLFCRRVAISKIYLRKYQVITKLLNHYIKKTNLYTICNIIDLVSSQIPVHIC